MILADNQQFNAKILLFGEYSLLYGSMALSIPFNRFGGELVLTDEPLLNKVSLRSNKHIKDFLDYLIKINAEKELSFPIDFEKFVNDVKAGLWFNSNIPQGYGLGSSGALVAAIFKTYGQQYDAEYFSNSEKLLKLKSFFSRLESYFHGHSSGLDPMISYLNQSLFISGPDRIECINTDEDTRKGAGAIFLIDSGTTGDTEPLVTFFKKQYQLQVFKEAFDQQFIPVVNQAIQQYLSGDTTSMLDSARRISEFQFEKFGRMIPSSMTEIWKNGMTSGNYTLKLCGSGGGGMMLGFTANIEEAKRELKNHQPIIIHQL